MTIELMRPPDAVSIFVMKCLPTSLCGTERGQIIMGPGGAWAREYCVSCGVPGGKVMLENLIHTTYVCNACFEKYGGLGIPPIPQDVLDQIVKED